VHRAWLVRGRGCWGWCGSDCASCMAGGFSSGCVCFCASTAPYCTCARDRCLFVWSTHTHTRASMSVVECVRPGVSVCASTTHTPEHTARVLVDGLDGTTVDALVGALSALRVLGTPPNTSCATAAHIRTALAASTHTVHRLVCICFLNSDCRLYYCICLSVYPCAG
jgi:hypothetical protein